RTAIYKYGPNLDAVELDDKVLKVTLNEIIDFLKSGKKFNFLNRKLLNPKWNKLIKSVKINDTYPASLEHFEAILHVVGHRLSRSQLLSRWERQVSSIG